MNTTNFITSQVDRSFLYLIAIYAVHGILLHVFLMHPQLDNAKMNWDIVAIHIKHGWKNSIGRDNSNIIGNEENNFNVIVENKTRKWSDISNLDYVSKNLRVTDELLYQPKFTDAATTCNFSLSKLEVLYTIVTSCSSTISKAISPAYLGIILGCMVFLLTFTDNIS